MSRAPVITIDGPSGTGKGTVAHRLADRLGWHVLDSGALYRIVACGAEAAGIPLDAAADLAGFALAMEVTFAGAGSILLNGQEIGPQVRLEASGEKASRVAVIPELRAALFQRQLSFRRPPGLVADGRDMGTVIFPAAELKFFLTASPEERAKRRHKQLKNKGVCVSLPNLLRDIEARDLRDSTRSLAPLKPAPDAVLVDTTLLSVDAVFAFLLEKVRERFPVL